MIGLAIGGVAIAGTIAYLVYTKSTAATSTTPALTTGTTTPFVATDFTAATSANPMAPQNTTAASGSGAGIASLTRSTGTTLVGNYTFNTATMGINVVSFTVTQGDGTTSYPVGTVITGVPNSYLSQGPSGS